MQIDTSDRTIFLASCAGFLFYGVASVIVGSITLGLHLTKTSVSELFIEFTIIFLVISLVLGLLSVTIGRIRG